jgi:hypothetical protein
MDCYDSAQCPVNDGGCELCDLYIRDERGLRKAWLRVRQFAIRLVRWDWSAGYVNLEPSASQAPGTGEG